MADAETPCGKFLYMSHSNLFFFFHSRTRVTLIDHSFFFSLSHRRWRMRHLRKRVSQRKNAMLQTQHTSWLLREMVSKSNREAPFSVMPVLQSRPPSLPTTPTGWRSNIITTITMGGCAASYGIPAASLGRQHPPRKRLFFFRIFKFISTFQCFRVSNF